MDLLFYEELRNRVSAYVGEKLAGQEASGGAQPLDIGQADKSDGEDEDVNARNSSPRKQMLVM